MTGHEALLEAIDTAATDLRVAREILVDAARDAIAHGVDPVEVALRVMRAADAPSALARESGAPWHRESRG
ncbi:MAG: hypothetical protein ACJ768_09295 [Gaiellaceae bacterium]